MNATDIASRLIPFDEITDNSYVALRFPPIPHSLGERYYIVLETERLPRNFAITTWVSTRDVYPDGCFFVNGQPRPQDAAFRAYYAVP